LVLVGEIALPILNYFGEIATTKAEPTSRLFFTQTATSCNKNEIQITDRKPTEILQIKWLL
jgi:hypothetical protein